MKFDSFSRFLKSELYNECLMAEMNGKPLKFESNGKLNPESDFKIDNVDIGNILFNNFIKIIWLNEIRIAADRKYSRTLRLAPNNKVVQSISFCNKHV